MILDFLTRIFTPTAVTAPVKSPDAEALRETVAPVDQFEVVTNTSTAVFDSAKAPLLEKLWYTSGAAILYNGGVDSTLAKITGVGMRGIPYLAQLQRDYRASGNSAEADKIATALVRMIGDHFETVKASPLTFKILEEIYPFLSGESDSLRAAQLIYRTGEDGRHFIASKIRMGEQDNSNGFDVDRVTFVSAVNAYRAEHVLADNLPSTSAGETIQILRCIAINSNDAAKRATALDDIVAVSSRYGAFEAGFAALKDLLPARNQQNVTSNPAEKRVYRLVDLLARAMQEDRQPTDKDFASAFETLSHLIYTATDSRAAVNVADYALHLGDKGRAFVTEFSAGRRYFSIHGNSPGGDSEMLAGFLANDLDKLLAETAED